MAVCKLSVWFVVVMIIWRNENQVKFTEKLKCTAQEQKKNVCVCHKISAMIRYIIETKVIFVWTQCSRFAGRSIVRLFFFLSVFCIENWVRNDGVFCVWRKRWTKRTDQLHIEHCTFTQIDIMPLTWSKSSAYFCIENYHTTTESVYIRTLTKRRVDPRASVWIYHNFFLLVVRQIELLWSYTTTFLATRSVVIRDDCSCISTHNNVLKPNE